LRVGRYRWCAAPITGSARNRVSVLSDFGTRRRGYYPHSGLLTAWLFLTSALLTYLLTCAVLHFLPCAIWACTFQSSIFSRLPQAAALVELAVFHRHKLEPRRSATDGGNATTDKPHRTGLRCSALSSRQTWRKQHRNCMGGVSSERSLPTGTTA